MQKTKKKNQLKQEPEMVVGYDTRQCTYPFITASGRWKNAEPFSRVKKVLMSPEKAVVKLIENGWKFWRDNTLSEGVGQTIETHDLRRLAGLEPNECYSWFPDYIFEEV